MKDLKNPTLTPMRALSLLREVEKARGSGELNTKQWALERVANELGQHIKHALQRRRR